MIEVVHRAEVDLYRELHDDIGLRVHELEGLRRRGLGRGRGQPTLRRHGRQADSRRALRAKSSGAKLPKSWIVAFVPSIMAMGQTA